ncbi:MAG: dnaX [Candidatus Saccharibacteria bacterium]|nr:dnaX [Candidatus Saccharibacteria bacterium]
MGQALYRKYRSKSLSEIVGQKHITDTLSRAIKNGQISHAYLFTGPKGVGKTSIARILAHEVNGLPYTDESIHLDIIEIDAASNRRIDEIRDLRDKVHIAPTSAKYKVYIIDEVHMLTKEAFNALLKTLEEPPAHVIFILATTEAHKLPDTIVSRTQRFTFKAIEQSKAVEHLRELAHKEKMDISDDALELLAVHGGGSFRDAIGLLDQIGHSKKTVSRKDVEELIGIAPEEAVQGLLDSTLTGQPSDIINSLENFTERGIAPAQISKQVSGLIRKNLLENKSADVKRYTQLLADLLGVTSSQQPGMALEIALFNANSFNAPELIAAVLPVKHVGTPPQSVPIVKKPEEKAAIKTEESNAVEKNDDKPAEKEAIPVIQMVEGEDISNWWPKLVNNIKKHNNTLYGVLRLAHPHLDGDTLLLSFAFGLHTKKVTDAQVNLVLQEAIKALTGRDLVIKAVQDKDLKDKIPAITNAQAFSAPEPEIQIPEPAELSEDLSAITSIFGGGEVLES